MNDSEDYRLDCLARHICRMPTREARHRFLAMMEKHHGSAVVEEMKKRIHIEWDKMYKKAAPATSQEVSVAEQ